MTRLLRIGAGLWQHVRPAFPEASGLRAQWSREIEISHVAGECASSQAAVDGLVEV